MKCTGIPNDFFILLFCTFIAIIVYRYLSYLGSLMHMHMQTRNSAPIQPSPPCKLTKYSTRCVCA